jgi:hypothetical protein
MTVISVRYFMPHLIINLLEMDKCCFFIRVFSDVLGAILCEEIAVETNRCVFEKNKLTHACGKIFGLGGKMLQPKS